MIWAIDPGEIHVGVAEFLDFGTYAEEIRAWEASPKQLINLLEREIHLNDAVVCEEFRLYPWRMKEQGFSQLKTVELIGVIRYLSAQVGIQIVEQPASIKKPTDGVLKMLSNGARFPSHGHGPHARDAELHGWHYLRRYLKGEKWVSCKLS